MAHALSQAPFQAFDVLFGGLTALQAELRWFQESQSLAHALPGWHVTNKPDMNAGQKSGEGSPAAHSHIAAKLPELLPVHDGSADWQLVHCADCGDLGN